MAIYTHKYLFLYVSALMCIYKIYMYKSSVPFPFACGAHFTGPAALLMLTGFQHHKSRKNPSSPRPVGHTWEVEEQCQGSRSHPRSWVSAATAPSDSAQHCPCKGQHRAVHLKAAGCVCGSCEIPNKNTTWGCPGTLLTAASTSYLPRCFLVLWRSPGR